jgi:hypothetical protein
MTRKTMLKTNKNVFVTIVNTCTHHIKPNFHKQLINFEVLIKTNGALINIIWKKSTSNSCGHRAMCNWSGNWEKCTIQGGS